MYLTDFRENTLQDVITKLEPDLFLTVTGLTVKDFHLLVRVDAIGALIRHLDAHHRATAGHLLLDDHPRFCRHANRQQGAGHAPI